MNRLPKSAFKRSYMLLKVATKLAAKETGKKLKETFKEKFDESAPELIKIRVEQALILTENLGQLKGAAMKLGQLISLEVSDFLPAEASSVIEKLYNKSEPIDFSEMRLVIIQELGQEKFLHIKNIDFENVFSASIGQVYKAQIDHQDIALKVQYLNVADTIESDLRILKKLTGPMLKLTGRQIDLEKTFEEIEATLKLEADYLYECQCLEEFGKLLRDYPQYIVPTPLAEYCTEKIICMSWVDGLMFSDWLKTNPKYEQRTEVAEFMLDLYILEFFNWGYVQTDPNFGNFLIQTNPLKLVLLDFGATKKYDSKFIFRYRELLKVFEKKIFSNVIEKTFEFGLLDRRESLATQQSFYDMLLVSMEPFDKKNQPFDFSSKNYSRKIRDTGLKFTKLLKYSAPPTEILFLHRKLGGVFSFIKAMEIKIDIGTYWEKMLNIPAQSAKD